MQTRTVPICPLPCTNTIGCGFYIRAGVSFSTYIWSVKMCSPSSLVVYFPPTYRYVRSEATARARKVRKRIRATIVYTVQYVIMIGLV